LIGRRLSHVHKSDTSFACKSWATAQIKCARFAQHHQKRRAQSLRDRLAALKREADRDIPVVVFGSRKLLRKRSAILKNDLEAIARWQASWDAARSAGFMVMGSKDETAGCQSCIGRIGAEGRLSPKLRLPNALASGSEKHLFLEDLELPDFGADAIRTALRAHIEKSNARTAITYRFVRDADWSKDRKASAWRVCITIAEQMPDVSRRSFETYTKARGAETTSAIGTKDIFAGAIGVDINADHLAWAVIDRFGNPLKNQCGKIPLPLRGKVSGHRDALIGDAVGKIIAIAVRMDFPIVLEKLDFKAKKQDLKDQSASYARMLSSFAYAKIQTTFRRSAIRAGVELVDINPAYTSVIGQVNYAERYGLSVHISAAVSIARRAAQFSERVNYFHGLRGLPVYMM
jgi:IS605 OrfB family transposase